MSATPARCSAREIVTRVRERSAFAHEVLNAVLRRATLAPEDAALCTRIAYGAIQGEGTLDEALDRYLGGRRIEPRVRDALRVSAYEILFLHTEHHTAVHQGVELVRSVRPQAAGLANAILRKLADDVAEFPWGDAAVADEAFARQYLHPRWLVDRWTRELGRDLTERVMAADNEPAPLYVAVNPFVATAEEAFAALVTDGAKPERLPLPGCLVARNAAAAVHGLALSDGLVIASDAAAQLVTLFARPAPGQSIVEIGAGRGTKTILLQAAARRAGGSAAIYAVDVHDFKIDLLRKRLARFGVDGVMALVGDATDLSAVRGLPAMGTVDAVLVDAPCSGLGTLRRHPEKRWRVAPGDIADLAELGASLLREAAHLVRPGGFVVYSTCTIIDAENADVVNAFLASERGRDFAIESLADDVPAEWSHFVTGEGFFRSVPDPLGPDGHFAVRLRRAAD